MPHTGPTNKTPSQRVVTTRCHHCGDTFEPVRPHQAYCRPSCRWESFKAKRDATPRSADPVLFDR